MPQRSYWAVFSIAPTHGNDILSVSEVFQSSAITLCLIRDGHHPVGLANHRCGGLIPSLAQTSVGPFIRCGGFSLHPSAKNLLKVDIYILHSYLNLLL